MTVKINVKCCLISMIGTNKLSQKTRIHMNTIQYNFFHYLFVDAEKIMSHNRGENSEFSVIEYENFM